MNKKNKALIKDLELQIDFLIGYRPQGLHWKQEYHMRETMIQNTLGDENVPSEIKEKIITIMETLYKMRAGEHNTQDYLNGEEEEIEIIAKSIPDSTIHDIQAKPTTATHALPYNWYGYVTRPPMYKWGKEAKLKARTATEAIQMFKDLYNLA